MKRVILPIIVFICLLLMSCSDDTNTKVNTINEFRVNLSKDMTHADILKFFGEPTKDIGSGIHIYVYFLQDSTQVWIGCTDVLLYANHMDQDHKLLEALI